MALSGELAGRTAVVTGATSGIGRVVAGRLTGAGAHVVVVSRRESLVEETAAALGGTAVAADVATEAGIERVRAAAPDAEIIVHAAGAFQLAPLAETTVPDFDRMMAVNLRAAFLLVRTYLPRLLERGAGDIVLIGSVAGRTAFASNGAYSASKFGLRGMHAVLAAEVRGTGVRATLVEPAATDTPLWDEIDEAANPGLPPRSAMLAPEAVAESVLYALSRPRDVAIPNILVERA